MQWRSDWYREQGMPMPPWSGPPRPQAVCKRPAAAGAKPVHDGEADVAVDVGDGKAQVSQVSEGDKAEKIDQRKSEAAEVADGKAQVSEGDKSEKIDQQKSEAAEVADGKAQVSHVSGC